MRSDHYDEFAGNYDAENSTSLLNEHYERPAMVRLAGDVQGRRILDAGCGSGRLAAELAARGALMSGFDGSPAMLQLARQRLADSVPLTVADLGEPLPYGDGAFDDVVASLVLHYLGDWSGPLAELRRVLRPGGRLIVSVNHPLVRVFTHPDEDYFATHQYSEEFEFAGETTVLTMWHRPLHAMFDAFAAAGFAVDVVSEPPPSPDTPDELLTPRIRRGETTGFLSFLFVVLEAR